MKVVSGNIKFFSYFILLILTGSLLLQLPWCYVECEPVAYVDALFTSVSAVCVTGLSTVPMDIYTNQGFFVILLLIEFGGLGILTFVSLIFSLPKKKISLLNGKFVKEYFIADVDYNPRKILKSIFEYTIIIQFMGFVLLLPALYLSGSKDWFFDSLFLSISAFCNAGFSPYNTSLQPFENNFYVLTVIMGLIVFGGIGFVVIKNCSQILQGKARKLSLHSKIVLIMAVTLIVGGSLFIFAVEEKKCFADYSFIKKIFLSLFQSVTTRTAGFEVTPQGSFDASVTIFDTLLMFIGGAPGSIAGGVKTTTVFVAVLYAIDGNQQRNTVKIGNYQLPPELVNKAITIVSRSILLLFVVTILLSFSESASLDAGTMRISELVFEATSAFATVGLSHGITGSLSTTGKIILILTMFIGRTGIFAMSLHISRYSTEDNQVGYPKESVLLG